MTEDERQEASPRVFVNSRGKEFAIREVQIGALERIRMGARREMEEAGVSFEKPTYQVATAGGDRPMKFELTEDSVEVPGDEEETARRRAALREYNAKADAMMLVAGNRQVRYIVCEGLVGGPTEEWLARCRTYGIDVPEDPTDRKLFFVMEEVCPAPSDLAELQIAVLDLSAAGRIKRSELEEARFFLRGSARDGEGREGEPADGDAEALRVARAWAVGGLDAVLRVPGDAGLGGDDRGGMGRAEPQGTDQKDRLP